MHSAIQLEDDLKIKKRGKKSYSEGLYLRIQPSGWQSIPVTVLMSIVFGYPL